jgi:PAS domain S-box-containing protein
MPPSAHDPASPRHGADREHQPGKNPALSGSSGDEKRRSTVVNGVLGALLDQTRDAIIVRELARDTIIFWNASAEALYGWTREEVLGATTHTLLQTQFPQPLATINETLLREGSWSGTLRHTTRSGQQIEVASHWMAVENQWTDGWEPGTAPRALLEINANLGAHNTAGEETRITTASRAGNVQETAEAARKRAEAAERAVQERDEFLSVAAHELKTPLTSLRGFAQILLTYLNGGMLVTPERIQRALRQIEGQTEKVNRLVDQLLDVTRLDAGRLTLDRKMTDLTRLVHEVVAAAQTQTSAHTLVVTAPPTFWAYVDAMRMEQVLTNLVGNAIKHSSAGGTITVSVMIDPAGEMVQLAVRDQGPGIPEEHRAHIFDRLYQVNTGNSRSGLGLGLYISRQIVALHGGQLTVEFPAEGGSRFVARIPASETGSDDPAGTALRLPSGEPPGRF